MDSQRPRWYESLSVYGLMLVVALFGWCTGIVAWFSCHNDWIGGCLLAVVLAAIVAGVLMLRGKRGKKSRLVGKLLLSFGVGLLLAGLSCPGSRVGDATRQAQVKSMLSNLKVASEAYMTDFRQLPPADNKNFTAQMSGKNTKQTVYMEYTPRDLNASGEMLDPWGTLYRIVANDNGSLTFCSAGKDRKFGTADDRRETTLPLAELLLKK